MAAGAVEVNITSPNARAGAKFDGVDDYIEVSEDSTLALGDVPQTISAWIKTDSSNGYIVGSRDTLQGGLSLFLSGGGAVQPLIGINTNSSAPGDLRDNLLHHIVIVYDTIDIKSYVDGILKLTDNTLVGAFDSTVRRILGAKWLLEGLTTNIYFKGIMNNVQIFNIALTQSEIETIYNNGKGLFNIVTSGLVAHFPLEKDYSTKVGDATLTNHGTHFGIFEEDIAAAVKADRVTANDIYLIAETGNGKQAITTIIEET